MPELPEVETTRRGIAPHLEKRRIVSCEVREPRLRWRIPASFSDANRGHRIVAVDRRYFRPAEVDTLLGDPSKAKAKLGWVAKTPFDALVEEMTSGDLREAERDALVTKHGHVVHQHHE